MKRVVFVGSSIRDLRNFPKAAKQEAGYQLERVQSGQEPHDWKPMTSVGPGCREIRIREDGGAFRVLYVAQVGDAVYVLHCFRKKTQKTSQADLTLGVQRYKEMVKINPRKESS